MVLEGHSLADSTQDNGVCVQSGHFHYLVDLENHVIEEVRSGEIYVPVCYRQMIGLNVGETVQIGETDFTIAGFLRDSQMNAMMASSKRFLVSESDYHLLKKEGSEEYLIEFLFAGGNRCKRVCHGIYRCRTACQWTGYHETADPHDECTFRRIDDSGDSSGECGLLFAFLSKGALSAQMRELYGASEKGWMVL